MQFLQKPNHVKDDCGKHKRKEEAKRNEVQSPSLNFSIQNAPLATKRITQLNDVGKVPEHPSSPKPYIRQFQLSNSPILMMRLPAMMIQMKDRPRLC